MDLCDLDPTCTLVLFEKPCAPYIYCVTLGNSGATVDAPSYNPGAVVALKN